MTTNAYDEIYAAVQRVPVGRVSSYGRIAQLLGRPPGHARLIGYALHALRHDGRSDVPWWRIINASGRISNPYEATLQRDLLEAEGVTFDQRGYVNMDRFLWQPGAKLDTAFLVEL